MFNSHHYSGVAALLPLLLLALVAVSNAADPCYNTVTQPGRLCTSVRCAATSNTTAFPLPAGETYASFYSWVLGILGVDGGDVKMAYVDYTTTDPNIYFAPNQVDCYVNVSFVYEVAAYRNRMGVFKFNRASPPTSASGVVSPSTLFAETSVDCTRTDGGSCLAPGSTLTLGPFSSSDGVGFYLDPNQVCGSTGRFYSVDALNIITSRWRPIPAMHGRLVAVLRDPNTKRVYFGWEDSPTGSDSDYNDVMFSVTSSCALDYTKIPCAGVATCRNPRQQFVQATCECTCVNQTSCPAPLVYDTDLCACACPATTCDAACPLNSQTCQCECPPSPTPTSSPSRTPSRSPSPSISTSPSTSPTLSSTPTPSNTPSNTPSPSTSPTPTPSPTRTPSSSPSPSISTSPSTSPTPSSTPTPSNTPSNSPTPSNTPSPSTSPTASSSPSASPTSSTSPSSSPSTSASPSPSNTPSPSASPSSSASPTPSSSLTPSPSASPSNSATPTPSASASPSPTPSISASPSSSPAPSSVASAYNVLLVGRPDVEFDFDMSNGQVEGRVAVNGGLRALGFGMGSRVVPCDASTAALVVDGAESRVNFQGGLQCGNLVAEPSARVTALPGFNSGNNRLVRGDVFSLTGLDFMAEATRAQATADAVCSGGGVAATVSPWREITFQGSASAPAQQSFVVQATDLSQAASARFVFEQPSAVESVVVAVMGGQVSGVSLSNFGINNGGVSGGRITFVVCDAPRLTLRGFGLEANLLAVDSQVTLENGQITGRIIAQTLTGSGGIRLPW